MTVTQLEALSKEFLGSAENPQVARERYELLSGALDIYKYLYQNGFAFQDGQKTLIKSFLEEWDKTVPQDTQKKLAAGDPATYTPEVVGLIRRSAEVRTKTVTNIAGYLEARNTELDLELLTLIPASIALEMFDEMASWQD